MLGIDRLAAERDELGIGEAERRDSIVLHDRVVEREVEARPRIHTDRAGQPRGKPELRLIDHEVVVVDQLAR